MSLVIIGDVHGKYLRYANIAMNYEYTLQLGDMGFDYNPLKVLGKNHRFFGGNHDNYNVYFDSTQIIGNGNFGKAKHGDIEFFFVRGGYSIDKNLRKPNIDWWQREELNKTERKNCLNSYKQIKPDIVISHEAPTFINRRIGSKGILPYFGLSEDWSSNTAQLLHSMFNHHIPKLWIHGHMHKSHTTEVEGCTFIGLPELGTYEIKNG